MACERPHPQLWLYLDGELVPPEADEMAQHLHTCPTCQWEAAVHRRLQALLRTALPEEDGLAQLWTAIQHRLAQESPPTDHLSMERPPSAGRPRRRLWMRLGTLAALMLVAVATRFWFAPAIPIVVQEIVDSQIRMRLMRVSYTQLPADPEVIRRWFDDKVEFVVPVPALPPARYTFLGARLNYFLDRRVAEMAYASGNHVLSFVMFSDKGVTLSTLPTRRLGHRTVYIQTYKGYTTVLWHDGTIFCGLVSDLQLTAVLEALRQAHAMT
jgi:anti-sigma factor RsiW